MAWSRVGGQHGRPARSRRTLALIMSNADGDWEEDPESMKRIDRALQLDSVAPQWPSLLVSDATAPDTADPSVPSASQQPLQLPQRLPPLDETELGELEQWLEKPAMRFSECERSLIRTSIESLDYLGNWSDPVVARDSIVLMCDSPEVIEGASGPEFSCAYTDFTAERDRLHAVIVDRMLTSVRTTSGAAAVSPPREGHPSKVLSDVEHTPAAAAALVVPEACGPPALPAPKEGEQHVFIVVGVPGSGKDTVLKRYLRTLNLPILDASADIIKEYLAAWGEDELSRRVRENNNRHGPGKHLLHAQYLHRESIMLVDLVVERALGGGQSVLLEKTMVNLEPVMDAARKFSAAGCYVHLLGTHIQPFRNWAFLENRMASGQAFGRYITKDQAITGLRNYQQNLEAILESPTYRGAFDSIHVYVVMESAWCVSWAQGQAAWPESPSDSKPQKPPSRS